MTSTETILCRLESDAFAAQGDPPAPMPTGRTHPAESQRQIKWVTLRDWEQKRKRPEGPARVLLMVIDKEPQAVRRALEPT